MDTNRREFLINAASGMSLAAQTVAPAPAGPAWLRKPGRIYFYDQYALNEQETAFAKYDPDRITAELVATGADVIVIYAANQFSIAYYPSSVWPQHPNLKGRDYMGDLFTRLRKHGKKVAAYINWMDSLDAGWLTVPVGREKQEGIPRFPYVSWTDPRRPKQRAQKVPGGVRLNPCLNSPRREQILAAAREIVERYHPDAFCLDAFHVVFDVCVCKYCRPEVQKICGTDQITSEAISRHWREYIDWKMERSASVVNDLSSLLRSSGVLTLHNAGIPLPVRAAGGAGEDWVPSLDILLLEGFGSLDLITMTLRACRSLGKPMWQLLTSSWPGYAHLSVPPAWWRATAATCKANGAEVLGPCGIGAWPDTTTSKEIYTSVKAGFDEFMRDSDLTEDSASASKIALMFCWNCRKYFPDGAQEWSQEILGWSRLLLREHLPFDIGITEQIRSASQLANYDLILLPNLPYLSDAFCAVVADYVRSGGRVLVTGETSLGDEKGRSRPDFALGDLLGIARKGSFNGSFAVEAPGESRPASGTLQQVQSTGTVTARMISLDPAGSVKGFKDPMPLSPSQWPLVTRNTQGGGIAMYVAFDVGRLYAGSGLKHIEEFMTGLLDELIEKRQVEVRAPYSVEVTVRTRNSPKRHIIHLANRTHSPGDMTKVTELVPVHDIEVSLASPFPRARVECRGGVIQTRRVNGKLVIRLASLDAHAALVISPA
jgi:hypothetical protein